MKLKDACSLEGKLYKPRQCIKKQNHHLANKGLYTQSYSFSSSHVQVWELAHKGWVLKNECFWTVGLENTLESPLDSKEIKPVNLKGNQSCIRHWSMHIPLEGLMLKLKCQHFGHQIWRADSLEKTLMLGKTEGRRRRGDREWDGWMASPIQWIWVWASSGRQWRIGKPAGMLQSMGSQRVRPDWVTEPQQNQLYFSKKNNNQKWETSMVVSRWWAVQLLSEHTWSQTHVQFETVDLRFKTQVL